MQVLQQKPEKTKKWTNSNLSDNYHFGPIGAETYSTLVPKAPVSTTVDSKQKS